MHLLIFKFKSKILVISNFESFEVGSFRSQIYFQGSSNNFGDESVPKFNQSLRWDKEVDVSHPENLPICTRWCWEQFPRDRRAKNRGASCERWSSASRELVWFAARGERPGIWDTGWPKLVYVVSFSWRYVYRTVLEGRRIARGEGPGGDDLSRTFYGEGERPPRNRNANRSRLCCSFHSSVRILSNKDGDGADHCPAHRFACPQFHRAPFSAISRLFLDRMMFGKRFKYLKITNACRYRTWSSWNGLWFNVLTNIFGISRATILCC